MKSFLMIGQSNMAGRGDFEDVAPIENQNTFMLRNGKWVSMSEPINPDRCIFAKKNDKNAIHSGIGLAASFADEYAKHYDENIGLIPCADGGTSIAQWQPNEILYDNAVVQTKLAMRTSELSGILWHQGENDSSSLENVELYYERFIQMINSIKSDLRIGDIPIILGELGEFCGNYSNGKLKYFDKINEEFYRISATVPNCAVASAKGLTCRPDGIHFNSKSYREFGKRYFSEYLKLKRG